MTVSVPDSRFLADCADKIRALGRNVVRDVIEIGHHLHAAQEHLSRQADGDGDFLTWVDGEFPSWSRRSVYRFIDTYKLARSGQFAKLANSNIDVSGLYLLAAPSTPDAAREEALRRVSAGESLRHADVQDIVAVGKREIMQAAKQFRAEDTEARRAERIDRIAEIAKGNASLPTGRRYPVILADPPWKFEVYDAESGLDHAADAHYPTLSHDELCAIPVAGLALADAVLFMWSTVPHLCEALAVLAAWGFEYVSQLVWVKDKVGLGFWVRNQHEILLIARRGDFPAPPPSVRPLSVVHAPRREHSRKPDEVCALIERMYPTLPRIELFARQARPGWDAWGNEVASEAAE